MSRTDSGVRQTTHTSTDVAVDMPASSEAGSTSRRGTSSPQLPCEFCETRKIVGVAGTILVPFTPSCDRSDLPLSASTDEPDQDSWSTPAAFEHCRLLWIEHERHMRRDDLPAAAAFHPDVRRPVSAADLQLRPLERHDEPVVGNRHVAQGHDLGVVVL